MLPSVLASEIRKSTRSFLVSAFEASDGFFHGVMQRFVDREHSIDKGPYVQVGLPFRTGSEGKDFFGGFEIAHPGFAHQEGGGLRQVGLGIFGERAHCMVGQQADARDIASFERLGDDLVANHRDILALGACLVE